MLPTAPRRGCLAPSGRGLWRGAGRRVASSPPGGVRSESVPRAAPCETAAYSLVCGLGRAVSASAKPLARDCIEARFSERTRLPSLAGLWLSSVVRFWHFDYGLLDARWTCPPESAHIRATLQRQNRSDSCGASQIIQASLRETAGLSHKLQSDIGGLFRERVKASAARKNYRCLVRPRDGGAR